MPTRPELPPTRTLAWLYTPATQRPVFAALCGIEREIGASLKPGLDHEVAHTRLAWWREECARCAQGHATHPLTRELGAGFAGEPGTLAALSGLVDLAAWDLAAATFATRAELTAYCERWSAAFTEPLARNAAPTLAPECVRAVGASLREIELLLALHADARAGRLRLPLDELARARIAPEELARRPWPPTLAELIRTQQARLRRALAAGVAALAPQWQPPLRGLLVWAAIAAHHGARRAARLPRASAAGDYHAPLDAWRAWRAARRAGAGRLVLAA